MIKKVINECNKMGLTVEIGDKQQEKQVSLTETAEQLYPESVFDPLKFRLLISQLIMEPSIEENHDLCKLLAWFLAQDINTIPGDQEGLEGVLRKQVGDDRLGLTNDARYGDLLRWSVFLGLAWPLSVSNQDRPRLIPDPSGQLEALLPRLFAGVKSGRAELPLFVDELAHRCPVLDNGFFYQKIRAFLPGANLRHLSGSLSLALLRLQDRNIIRLVHKTDAPMVVIKEGPKLQPYSHVDWTGAERRAN